MPGPQPKCKRTTAGGRAAKRPSGTANEIEHQAKQAGTASRAENEMRRQAKRGQQHS